MTSRKKKARSSFEKNSDEIKYNLINSFIAGIISFASSFMVVKEITFNTLIIAIATAIIIFATKFGNYWNKEESEYKKRLRCTYLSFV